MLTSLPKHLTTLCLIILGGSVSMGCAANKYLRGRTYADRGQYEKAGESFEEYVAKHPESAKALRELGIAQYYLKNYPTALERLEKARALSLDSRTELFRGMALERLSRWSEAERAFVSALGLKPSKDASRRIEIHLERITRRAEIKRRVLSEQSLQADSIPPNTVAVYDFDGASLDLELRPLALAFAEFVAIDLAKVEALTVVERVKLPILMQELHLGQSGAVDRTTAPRVGRLLGSRRIISGWLSSPAIERLSAKGVIMNTLDSSDESLTDAQEDEVGRFFRLQKVFVYETLVALGIEATESERRAIDRIPTDSLSALMAFSRGLQNLRNGDYQEAESEFSAARDVDESFTEAGEMQTTASNSSIDVQFDNFVFTQTFPTGSDLNDRWRNVIRSSGVVPVDDNGSSGGNRDTEATTSPPQIPTGSAAVRGNPDGN